MFPLYRIATRLADNQGKFTPAPIGLSAKILDASGFLPGTLVVKPVGVPDGLSYLATGRGSAPAAVSLGTGSILKNFAVSGVVVWEKGRAYLLREHRLPTLCLTDGCAPLEGAVDLVGEVCNEHGRLTFSENGCAWEFQDGVPANGTAARNTEDSVRAG